MKKLFFVLLFVFAFLLVGKVYAAGHRLKILDTLNVKSDKGEALYSYEVMTDQETHVYCYVLVIRSSLLSAQTIMNCLEIK